MDILEQVAEDERGDSITDGLDLDSVDTAELYKRARTAMGILSLHGETDKCRLTCNHQFKRPLFPFDKWTRLPNGFNQETTTTQDVRGTTEAFSKNFVEQIDLETRSTHLLFTEWIHNLEKEIEQSVETQENRLIQKEIQSLMADTVRGLADQLLIFRDARFRSTGSFAEKTKTGRYDEFDFMIELPSLSDRVYKEMNPFPFVVGKTCSTMKAHVGNPIFIAELLNIEQSSSSKQAAQNLLVSTVKCKVSEEVEKRKSSWKMLPDFYMHDYLELLGKVLTMRLQWIGQGSQSLDVFIDMAFVVPMFCCLDCYILHKVSHPEGKCQEHQISPCHLLLNGVSDFWHISFAGMELSLFDTSGLETACRRVLRLSKKILTLHFPGKYKYNVDTVEAMIPTYWMKSVLFYLMQTHARPQGWTTDNIPCKVLDLFRILHKCLEKECLSNFFCPFGNLLSITQLPTIQQSPDENLSKVEQEEHDQDEDDNLSDVSEGDFYPESEKENSLGYMKRHLHTLVSLLLGVSSGDSLAMQDLTALRGVNSECSVSLREKQRLIEMVIRFSVFKLAVRQRIQYFSKPTTKKDEKTLVEMEDQSRRRMTEYIENFFLGRVNVLNDGSDLQLEIDGTTIAPDSMDMDPYLIDKEMQELFDKMVSEKLTCNRSI